MRLGRRRPRVVIVGMGDTGPLVAVRLGRVADVVGISTKPLLVSGQELGWRLTDPATWRRNYLVPFDRIRRLDRVELRHGKVHSVDTDRRTVRVTLPDGNDVTEPYDALLVASGAGNGFWRDDRISSERDVEEAFGAHTRQIGRANSIAVVGGGATGVSVAANLARAHPDKRIHLFHGGDRPLPGYHPRARRRIQRALAEAGVEVHPDHRAVVPDGATSRMTTEPVEWSTGQEPFTADLVLWAIGRVRPHSDFLPDDMLDEDGFVHVDEHLRVPGYQGVFAVGDVAATDVHRSSARNWGYLVAARNIRVFLRGRGRMRRFSSPTHRWGSVLGPQADGLTVFQPDGRVFRVPQRLVQPLLYRGFVDRLLYRGVRR